MISPTNIAGIKQHSMITPLSSQKTVAASGDGVSSDAPAPQLNISKASPRVGMVRISMRNAGNQAYISGNSFSPVEGYFYDIKGLGLWNPTHLDPVAFITRGHRGMGKQAALSLSASGCKVIINYSAKYEAEAMEVYSQIKVLGGEAYLFEGDVTKEDAVMKLMQNAVKKFGKLDILVNNAGIPFAGASWDDVVEYSLTSTFLCTREALKVMGVRGTGRVINITNSSGLDGPIGEVSTCAVREAIIGFTKGVAQEHADIRVNAIWVGLADSASVPRYGLHKFTDLEEAIKHLALTNVETGKVLYLQI